MLENSKWIKSPKNKEEACYEFYTDFNSEKEVVSAILDITAMGMYCAFINSQRVGDEFFTPVLTRAQRLMTNLSKILFS